MSISSISYFFNILRFCLLAIILYCTVAINGMSFMFLLHLDCVGERELVNTFY